MKLPAFTVKRGLFHILRGLCRGRPSALALGAFIVLARLGRRKTGRNTVKLRLAPGKRVGLRVSRPGDQPVNFHIR